MYLQAVTIQIVATHSLPPCHPSRAMALVSRHHLGGVQAEVVIAGTSQQSEKQQHANLGIPTGREFTGERLASPGMNARSLQPVMLVPIFCAPISRCYLKCCLISSGDLPQLLLLQGIALAWSCWPLLLKLCCYPVVFTAGRRR